MSSIVRRLYLVSYLLSLYLIIVTARSIVEPETTHPNKHEQQILTQLTDYRHRFEHSTYFKQLRWTLKNRYNKAYCQFCDLVVPVVRSRTARDDQQHDTSLSTQVRLLIGANQSDHIENVVVGFCKEFKLIDIDVCMGAVHEYRVEKHSRNDSYDSGILFLLCRIGCSD
jgi:hypothetical protein